MTSTTHTIIGVLRPCVGLCVQRASTRVHRVRWMNARHVCKSWTVEICWTHFTLSPHCVHNVSWRTWTVAVVFVDARSPWRRARHSSVIAARTDGVGRTRPTRCQVDLHISRAAGAKSTALCRCARRSRAFAFPRMLTGPSSFTQATQVDADM